jgi:SAM-dependent methyltransferase
MQEKPEERALVEPMQTYVQYGSGPSFSEGWINFDASPTLRLQRLPVIGTLFRRGTTIFHEEVRFGDIINGLNIAEGTVDGVYASHVLEHLSQSEFWIALDNTFRMLKPGGIFRLVIPDLESRARRYLEKLDAGDPSANSWFMRTTGLGIEKRRRGLEALARNSFGNSAHLWMWDEKSMSAALQKVGFIGVRRCRFNDCADQAFRKVEDFSRFYSADDGIEECGMETIKPEARSANGPIS